MAFYTWASICNTKATLPYSFKSINPYIKVLFLSVVWCMHTGTADSNFRRCQQKIVFFFFAYSRRPLLDNADICTSTLILCKSLNYSLIIDTKLGTMLYILLFCRSLSYAAKTIGITVAQHCVHRCYAKYSQIK